MLDNVINLGLMKNPLNWFIVFFMVLLPLSVVAVASDAYHGKS